MTNTMTVAQYYDWTDRIERLELSRRFVLSILKHSTQDDIIAEFTAKLKAIDNEINELLK